jgi:hypothetical protein
MNLDDGAVQILRGCSPHRACEAREVGLIFISEDPGLIRAMAIAATECSSKAAANVRETHRKFRKDVKSNGTNRRSPLESTKVPKKRTQKASKKGRKMCPECAKKHKQSERTTPRRPNSREGEPLPSALRAGSPPAAAGGESLPNPPLGTKSRCDISDGLLLIYVNS